MQKYAAVLLILCCLGLGSVYAAQEVLSCPGAPPPRLTIGTQGQMSPGPANNLRAEPSTRGDYLGQLESGDIFDVLAGPVCADGYAWWLIDWDGLIGWTAEGVNRDYWLEPYPPPNPTISPTVQAIVPSAAAFANAPFDVTLADNESVIALMFAPPGSQEPDLYFMNPNGGDVRLVAADDVGYPVWSPDGRRLLYGARQFYVLDVLKGVTTAFSLADDIFGNYLWSPDGTQVIFSSPDANTGYLDILAMDVDSGAITNLTEQPGNERYPSWSPDGGALAFLSERDGLGQIFRLDLDTGNIVQLTFEGFNNWPVWSPDGRLIAWISGQQLMTMDTAGGHKSAWTLDNTANYPVSWSPDSLKIAYSSLNVDGINTYLYVLDIGGGVPTQLHLIGADDPRPSWSPDGTQLIFQSYDGLYRVNVDGTGLTKLVPTDNWLAMASWRPSVR
jgi:hypothetical protein